MVMRKNAILRVFLEATMSNRLYFSVILASFSMVACSSSSDGGATPTASASPTDSSVTDTGKADSSGSDSTTPTDTTGTDSAKSDTGSGTDTAPFDAAGVTCGSSTCTGSQICCVDPSGPTFTCAASCSDGGVAINCDGPEDCTGGGKVCCGTINVGAGTPPTCPISTGSAACASTCDTKIPTSCPDKGSARLCHAAADCASDASNKNCCTFSAGGASGTFCVGDAYKLIADSCF